MNIQLNWSAALAAICFVAANPVIGQALEWAAGIAVRNLPAVNWKRLAFPGVILLLLLAQRPADAQMRRNRGYGPTSAAAGTDPGLKDAVATFDGTLASMSKKEFTVDLDTGNTVVFKIGKKTLFFVGDKPVKPKDLAPESTVKVEGTKDGFGVLTATKLTVKPETTSAQ